MDEDVGEFIDIYEYEHSPSYAKNFWILFVIIGAAIFFIVCYIAGS